MNNNEALSSFDRQYLLNWRKLFTYEACSFLGRLFYNKKAPTKVNESAQILHLGCGSNYIKEFINADYFYLRWLPWRSKKDYDWLLDFRVKMKCENNHWDGVFSEHTIEHLHPTDCIFLFKELYRTMKPGAWMRICVPGLEEALELYAENGTDKKFTTRAEAIYSLTQNFGHISVWDKDLFIKILSEIGFINTQKVLFMQGNDQRLLKDGEGRKSGSLYIESQKPN